MPPVGKDRQSAERYLARMRRKPKAPPVSEAENTTYLGHPKLPAEAMARYHDLGLTGPEIEEALLHEYGITATRGGVSFWYQNEGYPPKRQRLKDITKYFPHEITRPEHKNSVPYKTLVAIWKEEEGLDLTPSDVKRFRPLMKRLTREVIAYDPETGFRWTQRQPSDGENVYRYEGA